MNALPSQIPVLAAALLFSTAKTIAIPSTLRVAEGSVIAVEPAAKRLVFERKDNQKHLILTWNERTAFLSGEAGGPLVLKTGQRVRLSYGLPLFGPDYVRRVVALPAADTAPRKPAQERRIRHHFSRSSRIKNQQHPCK